MTAADPGPAPAGLVTVGHGRLDREALGALLSATGVERLVDVRRFPGSRSNPDVSRDALGRWLPEAGIGYRWEERLGGRLRRVSEITHLDPADPRDAIVLRTAVIVGRLDDH